MFHISIINTLLNAHITTVDLRTYNPFRFSSEYFDSELGLIYYNYRHYNPTSGRWLSRDPIAEKGGFNLYFLVQNNPMSYMDILGLRVAVGARGLDKIPFVNHTFISIFPEDLDGVLKCCPKVASMDMFENIRNNDGMTSLGLTLSGFNIDGDLMSMRNEESDVASLNNNKFEDRTVPLPSGMNENQFICKLLTYSKNYNQNRVPYSKSNNNCTNWALSIFAAMGIEVDVDFWGIDKEGDTRIEPYRFDPSILPPPPPPPIPPLNGFPLVYPLRYF